MTEPVKIGDATLYHADCMDVLLTLEGVDCVITDPPYGMNFDDWDIKPDIPEFTKLARSILKPDGFYAFFGVMPHMLEWCDEAGKLFKFSEHVSWLKRMQTPFSGNLNRSHESIMIYRLKRAKFYDTVGPYSDVKVPGLWFDAVSIESIQRNIQALHALIKGRKIKGIKNDAVSNPCYEFSQRDGHSVPAPEIVNFTNVWSFLSTPDRKMTNSSGRDHPTQKPILLMDRLVRVLSEVNQTICDSYMGSGSTGVACARLGRKFIGIEIEKKYFDIACERIDREYAQGKLF